MNKADRIAAGLSPTMNEAVRAYLASDGVVDNVALAIKNEQRRFMGLSLVASLDDLQDHQKRDELRIARAALTAATK